MNITDVISYCRARSVELRLDGDRLKLVGNKDVIDDHMLQIVREHKAKLIDLFSAGRNNAGDSALQAIPSPDRGAPHQPSFNQQRLWFQQKLTEGESGSAYNGAIALEMRGRLDLDALRAALDALVERHESLRTNFVEIDGSPFQRVSDMASVELATVGSVGEGDLDEMMRMSASAPFDLVSDLMIRATLYVLALERHVLLLVMNHIASDAWSQNILIADFCAIYNAHVSCRESALPELPLQYLDYSRWERDRLRGKTLTAKLDAWKAALGDAPRLHSLPCDRPRSMESRGAVARVRRTLSPTIGEALKRAARANETTLFNVAAATYTILLHRMGGHPDVVFGMPVANRAAPELETIVGYFSNTVVLRNRLPEVYTFEDAISTTKRNMQAVFADQDVPFDMLVEELKVRRSQAVSPVYQLWFSMHEERATKLLLEGLEVEASMIEREQTRYDLKLEIERSGDEFSILWEYDSGLFDSASIEGFSDEFERIIAAYRDGDFTGQRDEASDVTVAGEEPAVEGMLSLPSAWLAAHAAYPDACALLADDVCWSRSRIESRALRLATLLSELGVEYGSRVAVCGRPSAEVLIAVLAAWRLGAACLPLHSGWSEDRIAAAIEAGSPSIMLSTRHDAKSMTVSNVEMVMLDGAQDDDWLMDYDGVDVDAVEPQATAEAWVFTSATGCETTTHGELAACAASLVARHGLSAGLNFEWPLDCDGAFANPMFTLAIRSGGTLVAIDADVPRHGNDAPECAPDAEIDVGMSDAAGLRRRGAAARWPRHLFIVERQRPARLSPQAIERAQAAGTRLIACLAFDPACALCMTYEPRQESASVVAPLLGRPVAGVHAVLRLASGPAVRGGWGRLMLATGRAVADAASPDASKAFRDTGIRARIDHRGRLLFGGLIAAEIVRRGYRFDPQDVVDALLELPDVSAAAVRFDAGTSADGVLHAFVVADAYEQTVESRLKQVLPQHQLPDAIITLDAIALDAEGRVDLRALPAVGDGARDQDVVSSDTERELQAIWSELLSKPNVSPRDHFFEIGGHSLLATRMLNRVRSRLWADLALTAIFDHPVLRELATHIDACRAQMAVAGESLPPIEALPANVPVRLSHAQRQLWLIDRMEGGSSHYNMVAAYRLHGALDERALESALRTLTARHDALRTRFVEIGDDICQVCDDALSIDLRVVDYTDRPQAVREALLREEATHRFDLTSGMLLRATLVRLGQDDAVLALNIHHIACDGWSVEVLMRELSEVYASGVSGKPVALPPLRIRYRDYAEWQHQAFEQQRHAVSADFWRRELADAPPTHPLIPDLPRPAVADHAGAEHIDMLGVEALEGFRRLARAADTTMFVVLESLFALFTARIGGVDDVVIGTAVSGRVHGDTEPLIGLFANLVPLRHRIDPRQPLAAYLADSHDRVGRALGHQHYPFETLVETLSPERSLGMHPVFQIAFGFKNADTRRIVLLDVVAERVERDRVESKFDLMLSAVESADGLRLEWQYATSLFEPGSVALFAAQFRAMLESVLSDSSREVGRFNLLSDADHRLIEAHRAGPDAGACDENLFDHFIRHALESPERTALKLDGRRVSYSALAAAVQEMAAKLAGLGVVAGDHVALLLPRGEELVVCLLGLARIGAAYVPIDTTYPTLRIEGIVRDCDASLFVHADGMAFNADAFACPCVSLDALNAAVGREVPIPGRDPERAAYLMYTSGSTGTPKGVVVPQRAILRLVRGDFMTLDRGTTMLQMASIAFDASTIEVWGPLLNGGCLAIYPDEALDLRRLTDFLREQAVDSLWLTAALFEQWALQPELDLPQLRQVLAGGDVVPPHAVHRLHARLPDVRVINGYGPTENTTFTCCHTIDRSWPVDRAVPIGRPIAGTHVRVVDAQGEPLPIGGVGELLAGGLGLAQGYWGNPGLTAEKFVVDATTGERLYRTGDLVRWHADGTLRYIGRSDDQIKIRGYRIELDEIKRCLLLCEGVAEACLVVRDEGERSLIAYYAPDATFGPDAEALRNSLRSHAEASLPRYMVPAAFVALEAMPVTPNGKVDRRALPAPQSRDFIGGAYVAPSGDIETRLSVIWSGLLALERAGVEDDFFALGGNSLLAIRMSSAYEAQTGAAIPIREIFTRRTIRSLACWVAINTDAAIGALEPVRSVPRDGHVAMSYAQQRLWFIDRVEGQSSQYNMPALFDLRGDLDLAALQSAIDALAQRHEVMRTRYVECDGVAMQSIERDAGVAIEFENLSALPEPQREEHASALLDKAIRASFDLAAGPVFRVVVLRLDAGQHRLLFNLHHIASDGWSVGILIRDLAALYANARGDGELRLPALTAQYAEYAEWQRDRLSERRREALLGYWRGHLEGLPQLHALPLDRPRPPRMTTRGAVVRDRVPPSLTHALNALARKQDASLFMLLQAAYALLLSRVSGERDIVVGTPVAGRERPEFEPLVGCFVNTLVLRNRVPEHASFAEYLSVTRDMVLDAFEHQELQFDMLVEGLNPVRSASHLPLFQIWFVLQNMEVGRLELPGLVIDEILREEVSAKFDLMLSATEREGAIDLNWVYNSDLFDAGTIKSWANSFRVLLAAAANAPQTEAALLPLVGTDQRISLETFARGIDVDFEPRTMLDMFLERAKSEPNRIAVRSGDSALTYGELAARAERLAGYLVDAGVERDELVCVACGRSIEQLIAVLGAWHAGAAFVPVDHAAPKDRIAFVVEDAAARWVLATNATAGGFDLSKIDLLVLDGAVKDPTWLEEYAGQADLSRPDGLAYVIYTSGTTGKPKGALIGHASLSNLGNGLDLTLRENGIATPLRWAWNAPLVFDAALQAITQLAVGSELHVLSEDVRTSPTALVDYLRDECIELLDCTPSLLEVAMEEAVRRGVTLPHLLIGGETIHHGQWEQIARAMDDAERVALNVYGPTETTVDATWARIASGVAPTIGQPLPNVRVRVLDERLQPVPPGAVGECCIAGPGLARGYLNRDALTAEKFVEIDTIEGKLRHYRSGDIVRWTDDGRLMYLHRRDGQIKLRGYRIELGEIQNALASCPGVVEAAVVVSKKTGSLVAYLVLADASIDQNAAIEHCRRFLPEYMLPAACVFVQELPLTRNGKLDVAALPEPADIDGGAERRSPESVTELALAAIWERILSTSDLPADGNFFALGGHSLLAIRVISEIREGFSVDLPLATFFGRPTIAQMAETIDLSQRSLALPPLVVSEDRGAVPLSFSQHRLWLIDRLEGGSPQYNMPAAFRLDGLFDEAACRRSLELIVRRHEVLRTTYAEVDGRPLQCVHEDASPQVEWIDLSGIAADAGEAAAEQAIRDDAMRPFSLDRDVMLRAKVLKLASDRHILVFNMHHIASDGWSITILIREFVAAYTTYARGELPELPELRIQYADFASWQRRALADEVLAPQVDYWKGHLSGLPQVHSLPLDKPRPRRQTYNGAVVQRRMDGRALDALKRLASERGATLFMVLQSALSALVARWSNESDIVIGTPIAGREDRRLENLIGFFLNTVILRSDLSGNPSYDDILARTRENVIAAFSNQHVPFDLLVDTLNPERSISHPTLFQIMFVLQNQEQTSLRLPGLEMAPVERSLVIAKFDLLLNANEVGGDLELSWNYNTDLFERDTIERMADAYGQILSAILADTSIRLQAIDLLPEPEANRILREWNATEEDLPYEQCLHALFVERVKVDPHAVAVVDSDGEMRYGELFASAAALAERLRPHTVTPVSLIGVMLPRGRGQVIATLGVMMAGAAYLPIETSWPANRVDQVLEQGNARALIASSRRAFEPAGDVAVIGIDEIVPLDATCAADALAAFAPVQTPDQLAYVIFTSGSTGKPKGVAIEHRSATNTVLDINKRYRVGSDDAVLAVSALSFDLSVYDIFGPLAVGGKIVCLDEELQKDPSHWLELVERHRVSIWNSVPASAELLTAQYEWRQKRACGAMRVVMMSGDWIPPSLPARIAAAFPDVQIHSLGGATEGSIWSISYPILEDTSHRKSVPYGKPLANQRFYVLTDDLSPCPVGVAGELHIGGIGVAREYYGDPERTAASYIRHEGLGDRLYKTGDIGRYMPDGNIEFIGRKDSQVKLRGFRIELGEIEATLVRSPHVAEAVVMVLRDPTQVQQLVAYVTLDAASRGLAKDWTAEFRAQLSATLPNYMVPTHCVVLDAMPLSANNKVDRKRLPDPVWGDSDTAHSEPEGSIEELLADVWKEVLGRDRVSAERNFFEIGGSSVHLISIAGKANLRLGVEIGVVSYFQHPTIRAMAKFIATRTSTDEPASGGEKRSKSRLSQRLVKRGA